MKPFYADSGEYWNLADTFTVGGHFSLLNFNSPVRGYLLPLVNHGLRAVAGDLGWNDSSLAKLFNAAMFALIATVLTPRLAALAWPDRRWGFWPRIGLAVLLLVFWRAYLSFPLSDFPAAAAALLALAAASRADSPGCMLVAGLAAAAAINMRPAYIPLIPAVLGLVVMAWWEHPSRVNASLPHRALSAGLLVFGFVVISLPQSLASDRHYETASFVPGAAAGLSSLQFTEGMRLQRYETYVGTGEPGPRMLYEDETGASILNKQDNGRIDGAAQYVGVVARHPIAMAGLFVRHAINGLDQRYDTPYVEQHDTGSQRPLRLFGFILIFLALARLAWPAARRSLGRAQWRYPGALLLCSITSLVSAVETRFLLPVYLLSYMLLLTPGWPSALISTQTGLRRLRTPALLLLGFSAFMAVVLHVVQGATDHLRLG